MDCVVLYVSREGQTRRIAEAICAHWQSTGLSAECVALGHPQAAAKMLAARHVLLGASIHYGRLPAEVYNFSAIYRHELLERDAGFFCVNLTARKPGKDVPEASAYIRTFRRRSTWQPRWLAVFAGALRYPQYAWYDRLMIRFIMLITGGPTDPLTEIEYTDWEKVRVFAFDFLKR